MAKGGTVSDLINELSDGEDEFDVDLMAAGCRLSVASMNVETMGAGQLVQLYGFGLEEFSRLVDLLIERDVASIKDVFSAAEEISNPNTV
jgi:hypothetical protein